jgi:hypothetical protein
VAKSERSGSPVVFAPHNYELVYEICWTLHISFELKYTRGFNDDDMTTTTRSSDLTDPPQ